MKLYIVLLFALIAFVGYAQMVEVGEADKQTESGNLQKLVSQQLGGLSQAAGENIKGQLLTPPERCGDRKENGAWPWAALITYLNDPGLNSSCGGSLITTKHILSAAHCSHKEPAIAWLGWYATSTLEDGTHENAPIIDVVIHPDYTKEGGAKNDISIFYLAIDVVFNDFVSPICLPTNGNKRIKKDMQNAIVIGWSSTVSGGKSATVLQQVQVPILDNSVCEREYARIGMLASSGQFIDKIICAGFGKGGKDSCVGDAGGPLMVPVQADGKSRFYQIGVASYGVGCARRNIPGVFANVQDYLPWIQQNVNMKL